MTQHGSSPPTSLRPFSLPQLFAGCRSTFQRGDVKRIERQDLVELGQGGLDDWASRAMLLRCTADCWCGCRLP